MGLHQFTPCPITPGLQRAYDAIVQYAKEHNGMTPTRAELSGMLGLKTRTGCQSLVDRLESCGYITVDRMSRSRGISIVNKSCPHCGGHL